MPPPPRRKPATDIGGSGMPSSDRGDVRLRAAWSRAATPCRSHSATACCEAALLDCNHAGLGCKRGADPLRCPPTLASCSPCVVHVLATSPATRLRSCCRAGCNRAQLADDQSACAQDGLQSMSSAAAPASMGFGGRVVVVTGAGNGLGKAYALYMAGRGARVSLKLLAIPRLIPLRLGPEARGGGGGVVPPLRQLARLLGRSPCSTMVAFCWCARRACDARDPVFSAPFRRLSSTTWEALWTDRAVVRGRRMLSWISSALLAGLRWQTTTPSRMGTGSLQAR